MVTKRAWVMVGLALALGMPSRARAQPTPSGSDEDPRAVEAQTACIAGEVEKGVRLLADYFASTGDVTAVYNIGRCYEQNGLDSKAVPKFREYLLKAKDLSVSERRELEQHIGVLEARQRASAVPVVVAPPSTPQSGSEPSVPSSVAAGGGRARLRMVGVALGAVGGAGLAAGAIFALKVRATNDELAAERAKESPQAARYTQLIETGHTARTLQWASFGVGVAALATGTTCYLIGRRSPEHEARIAIAPWIGVHGGGAQVRGAF
jgi:hypothetical protein